jgi:hypothetical protein
VVNPAVQYMAYEWLTQRHTALKQKRLARAGAAAGRVKLSAGDVFMLGEGPEEAGGRRGEAAAETGWLAAQH